MESISIELDERSVAKIQAVMDKLEGGAFTRIALRSAVTKAARAAQKELGAKAQETYSYKGSFRGEITRKYAGAGGAEATLKVRGPMHELTQFSTTTKPIVRAAVLRAGGLKEVIKNGNRAFAIRYKSGHEAIAVRKGQARLPVESIYSAASALLIGSEKVLGEKSDELGELLNRHIQAEMDKILGG